MADQSIIRISKEIGEIQKNSDLSLAVAFRDRDVRNVKALIIGPHETPYEFGFFEFAFKFPKDYPRKSPAVTCTTTNGGRCRFNPNIYANGKVCLSILGTWRGEPGEEWSAAQGLESILISIQSLMSSNPYENEPGFENANEVADKTYQRDYVAKIRHETLRISVIQKLEDFLGLSSASDLPTTPIEYDPQTDSLDLDDSSIPWEPFKDLYKRRFLWYYDTYLEAIKQAKKDVKDGQAFVRMPFEGSSNSMEGAFNYTELEKRLQNIKTALDAELDKWATEGMSAKNKDTTVPVNLSRQFDQIKESFKRGDVPHNVELEDGNPFVWVLTYFGRPMTNFDGGMFRIKLNFSPRFPDEQPRAKFLTPVFHHRVTSDGILCYIPNPSRCDDVKQHIEAIFNALEEENPPYDPRTQVHPEAHRLYWGGAEGRKIYNRKLRRSVQQSMDDF
ncbi:ubiquitin-conjugating enzyme/RWD-like protein [Ustulina deusta]|nr:ubiquitin-conjugating enzyme/RWD-like protein [Ustulina deusta]KAI3334823.1 ubiquitin-conjugating enzyme/RWD-like protein [Ustulina deusta]